MLDLAPLHLEVEQHMNNVIENPNILLSVDATYTIGAMDGKEWENTNVVDAVLKRVPELPHLSDLVVVFFKGACGTWKCFTTEFTPGGIIDSATDLQKELAWMPATNDVMKACLDLYVNSGVLTHGHPSIYSMHLQCIREMILSHS